MPPPPIDRRDFLKGAAALGASVALPGCSDDDNAGSGNPDGPPEPLAEPADFDFPRVLALPFAHGVASGDPLADRVIIWTRITEAVNPRAAVRVDWEVATTPDFATILRSGAQDALSVRDWTVKVDVTGLAPATTYYYRFRALGHRSITGRTRTAPAAAVSELRFAVLSCSSYWSSYWSGLGHIADRDDLDLVIHCGDYIYDFVDEDEGVRARRDLHDTAYVDYRDWLNLGEVRRRYALWRSDPNLMRAHQQHPWFIVWDNHDVSEGYGNELPSTVDGSTSTCTLDDVVRAFHEWTPTRPVRGDGSGAFVLVDDGSYPEPPDPRLIFRKLPYGPLLDVYGIDTQLGLPGHGLTNDSSHLPSGSSLFGRRQFEWFTGELLASQQRGTTWRLVNNQTWIAPIGVPPVIPGAPAIDIPLPLTRWTDYPEERAALFQYLRGANPAATRVRNNVFVSGDVHGNWNSDLIEDNTIVGPYLSGPPLPNPVVGSTTENLLAGITRATTGNLPGLNLRADSVGVEFAPSSMGRGGADELVANAVRGLPFAAQVAATRAIELAIATGNKNVQFIEWVDHGYGIVHLTPDIAVFEHWWQDKLTPGSRDVLGYQSVAWANEDASAVPPRHQDQIDHVTLHNLTIQPTAGTRTAPPAPLEQVPNPR